MKENETYEYKNAYSDETLEQSDLIAKILIAGEEFESGRITRLEYYDQVKSLIMAEYDESLD